MYRMGSKLNRLKYTRWAEQGSDRRVKLGIYRCGPETDGTRHLRVRSGDEQRQMAGVLVHVHAREHRITVSGSLCQTAYFADPSLLFVRSESESEHDDDEFASVALTKSGQIWAHRYAADQAASSSTKPNQGDILRRGS